ncbi:condensation domain-containing protein, partial [uncultured Aquimarina sp.]|uniref:condensation domain-containing protein n=1 Tax=uncultured Aquimarina sp. TaxID=575652 RepID=UPI00260EA092
LFHSLFVFENYPVPKGEEGRDTLKINLRDWIEKVDYPLSVLAYEYNGALTIKLQYDGLYLYQDKADRHITMLESIIDQVIQNPDGLHSELSLLTPESYNRLVYEWNDTYRAYPTDRTLYDLFELQVER